MQVELTPEAESYVMDQGYDPVYGARPLKRYLQKSVETLSAKLILSGGVQPGDTIRLSMKDGELTAEGVKG